MLAAISRSFTIKEVRKRILFTLFIIMIYRFLAAIPVPNVDTELLKSTFAQSNSEALNFLNIFTGGGLQNLSIVALGVIPFINASIIIQLLTKAIPQLEELSKEGAFGRQKLNQYTQWLTLPITFIQAFGLYFLLTRPTPFTGQPVIQSLSLLDLSTMIISIAAGTFLLMWLGSQIQEKGVGQGISILIFAGILTGISPSFTNVFSLLGSEHIINTITYSVIAVGVLASVVLINEAYQKIPIQHSMTSNATKKSSTLTSFIPIKINQSGVMPIIFASAIIIAPGSIGSFLIGSGNTWLSSFGEWLSVYYSPTSILYSGTLFALVFGFTYFYTSMAHNPKQTADNLRKGGNYIPGVRPGRETELYLSYIVNRMNFAGGIFLGLIAILPSLIQVFGGISNLAIGGTGLLIIVSVALDTIKQVESLIITKDYELVTS